MSADGQNLPLPAAAGADGDRLFVLPIGRSLTSR
jgi:hypothetical protein